MAIFTQIVAALSPLLTLTALWQVKEWRLDRLKEHLRQEGVFAQLLGNARPTIFLMGMLAIIVSDVEWREAIGYGMLVLLGTASAAQMILRRQRFPHWTKKTIILLGLAIGLNLVADVYVLELDTNLPHAALLSGVVLLQAVFLYISWLLFLPIDTYMKQRVLNSAESLLAQYTNTTIIAITGSVGKTTTKELLAHTAKGYTPLFTPAYVNSEMGVANWLLKTLPEYKKDEKLLFIIEMGAYRKGEIRAMCRMTKPHIGIITHIGTQHLALFGDEQKLWEAKTEIIQDLPEDGVAIVNADCAPCIRSLEMTEAKKVRIGTGGTADLEAFDIEETATGILFRIDDVQVSVPLSGTHNTTNILLAIAAAEELGMSLQDCAKNLASFKAPSQTFAVRKEGDITILDDTHNASPESFRAAIAWAKSQPADEKVLLTPGLIELGPEGDRIQRELGIHCNGVFDRVIVAGKKQLPLFQEGYKGTVEPLNSSTHPVLKGCLLVCVGRMSAAQLNHVLPL